MNAFVFPGQGAQFPGMGYDAFKSSKKIKQLFKEADDILGFSLSKIMFHGSEEELRQTKVTQPAIFLHSIAELYLHENEVNPSLVAGHSLGEFSALVANKTMTFSDGLKLVSIRAKAMQKACENNKGGMAAILGLDDKIIEKTCESFQGYVVAANFNCPGQVVISGNLNDVKSICEKFNELGARRSILLPVSGAFHSELMKDAKEELSEAINKINFQNPTCPIYQNVDGKAKSEIIKIKINLINQLISPVKWTQSVKNMLNDGANSFTEFGPGKVLCGLIKKVDREVKVQSAF